MSRSRALPWTRRALGALAATLALAPAAPPVAVPVRGRVAPEVFWPVELYVDFRLVDGQPDWPRRLREKLEWADAALQTRNHELDTPCPVGLRALPTVAVYRVHEDGWIEGGSLFVDVPRPDGSTGKMEALRLPHDSLERASARRFETTRLYLAPGPGWSFARESANAAYAWLGSWGRGPHGRGGGTEGLIDAWGRPGWVIVHELGHLAGNHHERVTTPERCSLMSYGERMFPQRSERELCPANGSRLRAEQCERYVARARRAGPPPDPADLDGDGRVDAADLARARALRAGSPAPDPLPPCLGWTRKGRCRLYPLGDVDLDLDVDAADLRRLQERVGGAGG
jgi:hypothetical protein